MVYGIGVVTNENGEVLIDGSNLPLTVVAQGTASKTVTNGVGEYSIPVPAGTLTPMLFVKWPVGVYLCNYGVTSGNYKIVNYQNNGPSSLEYWLCSYEAPAPSGGYGIEIFDAQGNVNFTTNKTYMRIRDLIFAQNATTPSGGYPAIWSFNHSSTPTNYPVTVPVPNVTRRLQGPQALWHVVSGKRHSTTQFHLEEAFLLGATDNVSVPNFPFTIGPSPTIILGQLV